MTETLAPWDVARPTPQPSTAIASVAAPQQSDAGARALSVAGQEWKEAAGEFDRFGLHLETLQAQDAINQLRSRKDDLTYGPQGFMAVKGGDVINPNRPGGPLLDDYKSRFQAVSEDLAKNLGPRARIMFNEKAAAEATALKLDIGRHSVQQTELYGKSVFNSGNAQDTADAVRYSGDPLKIAEFATRARDRAEKYARSEGLDPGFLAASAESNVVRAAIESRAAQNDAAGALALFNTFGSKLDAKDTIEVGRTMKTVQTGVDARGYVAWLGATTPGALPPLVENYRGKITEHSKAMGVDPALAAGMVAQESRGDTRAISPAGARGLTQLMPGTASDLGVKDPHNPDEAIPGGIKYLKQQLDKYGNEELALMAYNWGPGHVDNWIKNGKDQSKVPAETRDYVQRVQGYKKAYADRWDPLREGVNAAVPVPGAGQTDASGVPAPGAPAGTSAAAGPPGYFNPVDMKIDAERKHLQNTMRNQKDNANRPDLLAAVKHEIDVQFETEKQQIQLAQDVLNKQVSDWVSLPDANGKPQIERPPPQIWNQLTYEKQNSIDATLKHNAKGTDPPWTPEAAKTFARLSDMATTDPDNYRNVDLSEYIPIMPAAQWRELQSLKNGIQKSGQVEFPVTKALEMGKKSLALMGVDTRPNGSDKDQALVGDFNAKLTSWLSRFQIENKRHPKDSEVQQHIDDMLIEGRTTDPNWWDRQLVPSSKQATGAPNAKGASGNQGSTPGATFKFTVPADKTNDFKPVYGSIKPEYRTLIENDLKASGAIRKSDTQDAFGKQQVEDTYARLMKVPPADRARIAQVLTARGITNSVLAIIKVYEEEQAKR